MFGGCGRRWLFGVFGGRLGLLGVRWWGLRFLLRLGLEFECRTREFTYTYVTYTIRGDVVWLCNYLFCFFT